MSIDLGINLKNVDILSKNTKLSNRMKIIPVNESQSMILLNTTLYRKIGVLNAYNTMTMLKTSLRLWE